MAVSNVWVQSSVFKWSKLALRIYGMKTYIIRIELDFSTVLVGLGVKVLDS